MKLLAKPKKVYGKKKHGCSSVWMLKTEQGWLRSTEVAPMIGLSNSGCVMQRIARMGWDHPDVLAPKQEKKGYCVDGCPARLGELGVGNDEWQAMG